MFAVFEPVPVGNLEARNRIIRSATWLGLADEAGAVTDALVERYGELSRGGAGIVVTGYTAVSPEGRQMPRMLCAYEDAHVAGLGRLAEAIHAGGALAALQLVHAGGQTQPAWIGGREPLAPSFLAHPQYPSVPRQLTFEEIDRIVGDFARAARRGVDAGYDMIQLHAAHGYLINQFLSPSTNHRADRYGGDLRKRFWFLQQVVAAVQGALGPDVPVSVKLNGADFVPGGLELEESCRVAEWLSMRGVALIEVSGGTPASGDLGPARTEVEPGQGEAYFEEQAVAIKRRVPCPVSLVGGLRSLDTLDSLLIQGVVDFFSLARPLIWEPDLPRRWEQGDRRPARCISCNGCFGPGRKGEGVRCVVREGEASV